MSGIAGGQIDTVPELATLSLPEGRLVGALNGTDKRVLEHQTLPAFLPRQRWFGAKDRAIKGVTLVPLGELEMGCHALAAADVVFGTETQRYFLPVSAAWEEAATDRASRFTPVLARLSFEDHVGVLIDSAMDSQLATALLSAMREGRRLNSEAGEVVFESGDELGSLGDMDEPRPLGAEQSNVSIAFGDKVILKLYRRLRSGDQPDVEVARFLTEIGHYANTPKFLGQVRHHALHGDPTTLAAAFAFVSNKGDTWTLVTEGLYQDLKRSGLLVNPASTDPTNSLFEADLMIGALLGRRTAELHKALAVDTDHPGFAVEALTKADLLVWSSEAIVEAQTLLDQLEQELPNLSPSARLVAGEVLDKRNALIERLGAAAGMTPSGGRSRIHGDFHLGQVLTTSDDFMIIDFEGEPRRTLKERRAKSSPLRDVAGMLRSFHYAAWTAVDRYHRLTGTSEIFERAEAWRKQVSADFLQAYEEHVVDAASYPTEATFTRALTEMFVLQKAIYEVGYELANRPDWVEIPLSGVRDLLNED